MTAAAPVLARCDGNCEAWHPQAELEQIGRLRYCGPCGVWELRAREVEADARRAEAVKALTPPEPCLPCCVPCQRGRRELDQLHLIDGVWLTHARPAPR